MTVDVAPPIAHPNPDPNTLTGQAWINLNKASKRETDYADEYKRLSEEQHLRDAAILAGSVGLSATAIFRGDANSLKFAGFLAGLTTFYDKVIPLSNRISAAQAAVTNYNKLLDAGNVVLLRDLDRDKNTIVDANNTLASTLGDSTIFLNSSKASTNPVTAQQTQTDALTLQKTITDGQAVLKKGQAAQAALVSVPIEITKASAGIDSVGFAGIALTMDKSIDQGFSATSPSSIKGASAQTSVATLATLASKNITLLSAIANVQKFLDSVDYVGLVSQIQNSAPPVTATSGSSTTITTKGKSS